MSGPKDRKRGRPKIDRPVSPMYAYGDMGRREREHHRRYVADRLNDTDAAACENFWRVKMASLAVEPYGIQLIPNDPRVDGKPLNESKVFHVYRDWPGGVRRAVTGSIWDGRKLIWRRPTVKDHPHRVGKLRNAPKIRCAHRSWKSAEQIVAASREPWIKPYGDDPAAHHAMLTVIGHLATPATKRTRTILDAGINKEIMAKRDAELEASELRYICSNVAACTDLLSELVARLGIEDDLEMLRGKDHWLEGVIPEKIFKVGIDPLKQPNIGNSDTWLAATRLWNWVTNNRHRAQMRAKCPKWGLLFLDDCRPDLEEFRRPLSRTHANRFTFGGDDGLWLGRSTPRAFSDDPGGSCCRWWTRRRRDKRYQGSPKKSCPLQCWQRASRGQGE